VLVPALADAFRAGLQALSDNDRAHVRVGHPRSLRGSIDLDTTLRRLCPSDARWDYAISYQHAGRASEFLYWVEIHPANSHGPGEVLAKLLWLRAWLRQHASALDSIERVFVWVSSGNTSFSPNSPQVRQLASQGLRHVGSVLCINGRR